VVVNFVAFETSSENISVAVSRGDEERVVDHANAGQRSGELALPSMHTLLAALGLRVADIDFVVFGQGPGSFSGVRVACAVAQGLAYGLGKRVIALPSHLALAEASGQSRVFVAADARMQEVYWSAWQRDHTLPTGWHEVNAPQLANPLDVDAFRALGEKSTDEVSRDARSTDGDHVWHGIGSAFADAVLAAAIGAQLGKLNRARLAAPNLGLDAPLGMLPSAAGLIAIARRMVAQVGLACTIAPHEAAPLYVRNKVALTIAERETLRSTRASDATEASKVAA
jgi:tRNA threonylcarbamoyladenosine biosynthesis protein TsaB